MTRSALLAVGVALAGSLASLAGTEPLCPDAETTVEMNQCVRAKIEAAEADLDRYLESARRAIDDDPASLAALDRSQTAWTAFREAECAAVYERYRDGTIRGVMGGTCALQLLRRRTHDLWSTYLRTVDDSKLSEPEEP